MFSTMIQKAINNHTNDDDDELDPNDNIIHITVSIIITIIESSTTMISLYPILWSEFLLVLISGFEYISISNNNSSSSTRNRLLLLLGQLIMPFTISISETTASNNTLSSSFEPLIIRIVDCCISVSAYTDNYSNDNDNYQDEHVNYRSMLRDSLRDIVVVPSLLLYLLTNCVDSVRRFIVKSSSLSSLSSQSIITIITIITIIIIIIIRKME